jgi:hypothetical protein
LAAEHPFRIGLPRRSFLAGSTECGVPMVQFFSRALRNLKQSPIWRQHQEAIAKLRESLRRPQDEQLKTPRFPVDPIVEAIGARVRAEIEAEQQSELERAPVQQAIEQPAAPVEAPAAPVEEPTAERAAPSEGARIRRKRPGRWAADWMKTHPKREDEKPGEYAQRMCDDMANAPDVTEAWDFDRCRREMYRKPKETEFAPDPDSVQTSPKHH